jgi:hypothetical protein
VSTCPRHEALEKETWQFSPYLLRTHIYLTENRKIRIDNIRLAAQSFENNTNQKQKMSVPQTEITNKSRYPLSFMASAVSVYCVVGFFFRHYIRETTRYELRHNNTNGQELDEVKGEREARKDARIV